MSEEFSFGGFGLNDEEENTESNDDTLGFDDEEPSFSGFGDDDGGSFSGFGEGGNNQNNQNIQGGNQVNQQGGQQGGMFGNDIGGDPFGVGMGTGNYATRKEAYVGGFSGQGEQIDIKKNGVGFIDSFYKLVEINKDIYKELSITNLVFLGIFSLLLGIALFLLKELLIYIVSYLTIYLQGLVGLDKFLILIIYFFGLFILLNYLDGVSKLLNTIQLPIKVLLLAGGVFFMFGYISSDILFSIFVIGIFPLTLMKLFTFNETDQYILEKIKKGASIEDTVVKEEINNIVNRASENLLGDLPEQQELLIGEVEEEEQTYQLWFEMLTKNKDEKQASGFLIGQKMNLYFLNYYEEEMPEV